VSKLVARRDFLRIAGTGIAGVGAAGLIAPQLVAAQDNMPAMAQDTTAQGQTGQGESFAQMNAHHKMGVDTFLQNIGKDPAFWGTKLDYKMDGDVKVFELTCKDLEWEVAPGQAFPAMAYNGIIPGPEIRVTEGDKIRVLVTNQMAQSTSVHWHGVRVPNNMDGVPYITQPPIDPGQTFTYEFTVRNFGTHMYHSHHNSTEQVTTGLLGPFIVEPKDKSREPKVDAEYTMVLNDSGIGFTINGKSFPYTQPVVAKMGQKIRIRYLNEGLMIHPFHLHGIPQLVFAKDGFYLPNPYMADTLNVAPGERYDVIVECDEPGAWAFHCHILSHAESRNGMFGMVTALVVQE
jgi:FtsP/CotA-like multicopper oxidase with cupredoxin domain